MNPCNNVDCFHVQFFLIISLTIASSSLLTLLSPSLALAGNTRSTVISALRPSSLNCSFPFFQKYSIQFSCSSLVSSWCTPLHNALEVLFAILPCLRVKCPFTYSSLRLTFGLFPSLVPNCISPKCSHLAFLAYFLSIQLDFCCTPCCSFLT